MSDRYVSTRPIQEAVKGREKDVLAALKIAWKDGGPHVSCPYPDHHDDNPSWRWVEKKRRAHCTCIERSHSIFDVVVKVEGLDFESAKLRVAEIIGRQDLIRASDGQRHQAMDAASLLRPPPDLRDESLARSYLAYRLDVPPDQVPMPWTPVVAWRRLAYYDPPAKKGSKPKLAGHRPCVVFGTLAPDGRQHAHRIYVEPDGAGKADLGAGPDGRPRNSKKSARLREGQSAAGCVVLWGDPRSAQHLVLAEGIETAAAVVLGCRTGIESGEIAVAAALSTSGIRSFRPWPATRTITLAADRDENKPEADRAFKAGEKAARDFARKHDQHLEVRIALPGLPGADADWLDILRAEGIEAVRSGVASAAPLVPGPLENSHSRDDERSSSDAEQIERDLIELVERAKADPGAPFEGDAVAALASARHAAPAAYQRVIQGLKQSGVRIRDLEREVRRANLRVIEGGGHASGFEATISAGPYFVTREGALAFNKETRDGPVAEPLCNFVARIVAEEVLDDGAEQRTVFVIKGALSGGRPLPAARVAAERYPAMTWVTEAWGMAPVIFAGQGKRDHLRVAIQMLSGTVPRRTVYGHLGWRRIDERWVYLHQGAGIDPEGLVDDVEVEAGADGLLGYRLPEPPAVAEAVAAVRASLATLDLGTDVLTAPALGAVYRAPLGEAAVIDFALHLTGPTGVFKSELAALAQAHFGAAFTGRCLPASWADTANMLEKKAFLAKDAIIVVDDFAPTGTVADVQRLHREADRLFRGAGNRSGRARMRADGAGRPTYHSRGLIVSTGEDIPSGQSLRARLLILEVAPGDIDPGALALAQRHAAEGLFASAVAGYLQWLAPRMDELKRVLPERQRVLREEGTGQDQHKRTPEIAASLIIGWEIFLEFAEEVEALCHVDARRLLERIKTVLLGLSGAQAGHQTSEEPAMRFLALLGACISSGRAHIAGIADGEAPDDPARWGWQRNVTAAGGHEGEEWRAKGERIGWLNAGDLFLDSESAFAAVQKLARDQGSSLPIKPRTCWKRLAEQGHLASRDPSRGTNTVRRTIGGRRLDVIHLKVATLTPETDQAPPETAQTDPDPARKRQQEQRGGQFGQFGQFLKQEALEESDLRDAVGWEIDI